MASTHINIKNLRSELLEYFLEEAGKGTEGSKECYEAVRTMTSQQLVDFAEEIGVNMKRFTFSV